MVLRRKSRSWRKRPSATAACRSALVAEKNAHVHAARLRGAHALELAGLDSAQQLGLQGLRNIGDLVQKQGAAFGHFEAPDAVGYWRL